MRTDEEIIKQIQKEIRERYDGIVSSEIVDGTIDWWTKKLKVILGERPIKHDNMEKCPMCYTGNLEYRKKKKKKKDYADTNDSVHAWICDACPCVIFEYWNDSDYKELARLIK
jgi:hypothetical protein